MHSDEENRHISKISVLNPNRLSRICLPSIGDYFSSFVLLSLARAFPISSFLNLSGRITASTKEFRALQISMPTLTSTAVLNPTTMDGHSNRREECFTKFYGNIANAARLST